MRIVSILIILVVVLAVFIVPQILFVVDETQVTVVTRFGEPVRSIKKPGLYVKTPFVERVNYLEKRLLIFDAPPDSLLTKDKKRLVIDVYARGRIVNPLRFVETVNNESRAATRAIDIIASELRREIGLDNQSEIIKDSREQIMNKVKLAVGPKLLDLGIEIVDVRLKRADFPGEIANSIYERMKAERKRKADAERAAGTKADLEKRASVDKQAIVILSEATRDSDIIRGCGEAEAISIFAVALQQDKEFYTFQRSLETYKSHLADSTMFVGSSSDLGKVFDDIRTSVVTSAGKSENSEVSMKASSVLDSKCKEIEIETRARKYLSTELGIGERSFTLNSTELTNWSDASLGCPADGQMYAKVITPGYKVTFDVSGIMHSVHTNFDGTEVTSCNKISD